MASKLRPDKIWFFDVTDPQLHPNGFTIYRVTCKVFPVNKPESLTETVIWKRYNDFKQLFKAMFALHRALHRRDKFPEFAKPKLFGRFDESVIEERRQSALRLLRFISEQPHLSNSNVLVKFLEGGKVLPPSVFPANQEILKPHNIDLLTNDGSTNSIPPDIVPVIVHDRTVTQAEKKSTSEDQSTSSISEGPSSSSGLETLDVESKPLEGTWNYPQVPDNISLGSSTGEDTDLDSTFGTPLKDSELSFFDPIMNKYGDWGDQESSSVENLLSIMPDVPPMNSSQCSSIDMNKENSLDVSSHGHGDKDFDLKEFDPLRSRTPSSVECGKGDIDLSNTSQKSGSMTSVTSLPSTPKSGKSTPRGQSPAVKQRSSTQSSVSSLTQTKGDYLVVAASQIGMAQECEVNGNFEMAFAYYKIGVDVLIQGVQADTDKCRQDAVRRKTAQYLMRAEELYNKYLAKENLDDFRWAASSCISPNLELDPSFAFIRGSMTELRNYKVLGTIDKVILVMDKLSDETYVIKTVHKSCSAIEINKTCLLPTSCPYMCNLIKFFETENAVYLLLQYASGGKLWNYIGAYLHDRVSSGFDDGLTYLDGIDNKNTYTGCQLNTKDEAKETQSDSITMSQDQNFNINASNTEIVKRKTESFVSDQPISFSKLQDKEAEQTQDDCPTDECPTDQTTSSSRNRRKRLSSFSSAELTFDDDTEASRSISHDEMFEDVLGNSKPSLQNFTINSFDSSDVYQRMDSNTSTSEHISGIPEEPSLSDEKNSSTSVSHDISTGTNEDDVFLGDRLDLRASEETDASEIIRSSKALIQSVDKVLSDTTGLEQTDKKSESLTHPDKPCNNSNDSDEPSIYDIHKTSDDSTSDTGELDNRNMQNAFDQQLNSSETANEGVQKPTVIDLDIPCDRTSQENQDTINHNTINDTLTDSQVDNENSLDKNSATVVKENQTSLQAGRKRTLNRMNSKTLTRSASFECDLRSPTKNRARAVSNLFDQLDAVEPEQVRLMESCIRQWAAEIVVAISKLHHVGIICRDLNPDNILLGDHGNVMITYFSRLPQVDEVIKPQAADQLYVAPEVLSVNGYDETCDWWSLGALLYELLVGQTLLMCHPGGINSHTQLYIPSHVSPEAQGLLLELLRYNAKERLGASIDGVEAIKSHPFFHDIDWNAIEGYRQ